MKALLAKCEPAQAVIHDRPVIREVEFQKPEATATLCGRIWKRLCGFTDWTLTFASAGDGMETWRRIEFRNEYEERRSPKMLDIHRWY